MTRRQSSPVKQQHCTTFLTPGQLECLQPMDYGPYKTCTIEQRFIYLENN
ncbi:uncharacterized protein J3R85_013294 [Psidium guajava]|nr:uncharacterized protein J3R85_013294 [Psidium guajava]